MTPHNKGKKGYYKASLETRAKQSAALIGNTNGAANKGQTSPNKGKKRSPEFCAAIAAGLARRRAALATGIVQ
jgi:hypothetical protein